MKVLSEKEIELVSGASIENFFLDEQNHNRDKIIIDNNKHAKGWIPLPEDPTIVRI